MSTAMIEFDQDEIDIIHKTIGPDLSRDEMRLFIQVCRQTGLNPFARQIYPIRVRGKLTIQTSIDGYRLLAQRSCEYAGQDGPYWYNPHTREWVDLWIEDFPPAAAKIGIMRKGFVQPVYAVASFKSYAARNNNGELIGQWEKMPEVMIAKCAEALGLRRTFPGELSGIYTDAEMEQAGNSISTVAAATQVPIQTEVDKKKARLNILFKSGKEKGLFLSKEEMAEYISDVLKAEIAPDDIASLMDEEMILIEQKVTNAAEMSIEQQSAWQAGCSQGWPRKDYHGKESKSKRDSSNLCCMS